MGSAWGSVSIRRKLPSRSCWRSSRLSSFVLSPSCDQTVLSGTVACSSQPSTQRSRAVRRSQATYRGVLQETLARDTRKASRYRDKWWREAYEESDWKLFEDFRYFLVLVWKFLDLPDPIPLQYDVARYLQHGPRRKVIEAFRGIGKSWITSAFVRLAPPPQPPAQDFGRQRQQGARGPANRESCKRGWRRRIGEVDAQLPRGLRHAQAGRRALRGWYLLGRLA